MIDELYYKGILDDKDIDIIQNNKNNNIDKMMDLKDRV